MFESGLLSEIPFQKSFFQLAGFYHNKRLGLESRSCVYDVSHGVLNT